MSSDRIPPNHCGKQSFVLPNGKPVTAYVYKTARRTGRRVIAVVEGRIAFDSGDHYDMGNVSNAFELWASEQTK